MNDDENNNKMKIYNINYRLNFTFLVFTEYNRERSQDPRQGLVLLKIQLYIRF